MVTRSIAVLVAAVLTLAMVGVAPAAQAAPTGTLSGTVTATTTDGWDGLVTVTARSGATVLTAAIDPATGQFSLVVPVGNYALAATYTGAGNFLSGIFKVGTTVRFPVVVDQTTTVSTVLEVGGRVSGTVTDSLGNPVPGLSITVFWDSHPDVVINTPRVTIDPSTGGYVVDRFESGRSQLGFNAGFGWRSAYRPAVGSTEQLVVGPGVNVIDYDMVLTAVAGVRGKVTPARAGVIVSLEQGNDWRSVATKADGSYEINDVAAGTYVVQFVPGPGLSVQWWPNARFEELATPITLGATQTVSDVDAALEATATISGRVSLAAGGWGPQGVSNVTVHAGRQHPDGSFVFQSWAPVVSPSGDFVLADLPPGRYLLKGEDGAGDSNYGATYWPSARTRAAAVPFDLAVGQSITKNLSLLAVSLEWSRVSGADRYATAVRASQMAFPGTNVRLPVVYIASGQNYPDALAAGPAALELDGGLLMVPPRSVPGVVLAELARLDPERIVIVGGAAAISTDVQTRLEEAFPDRVERLSGANRYDTSCLLAKDAFPDGVERAYVATGSNFPDALVVAPAAHRDRAPLLLVDGSRSDLSASTAACLEDLNTQYVTVVGGEAVISPGVFADLSSVTGSAFRIAGVNRYLTAVQINSTFDYDRERVFLATGTDFADALSGAVLAGTLESHLYLTPGFCMHGGTYDELASGQTAKVVILGGPAALGFSTAIETITFCNFY